MRLTASESVSYNSNIFGVANGAVLSPGEPRGDFTSTTTVGGSTRANWNGQQFFFDGSLGELRYLRNAFFNTSVYNIDAGDNWTLTSRCSGTLTLHAAKAPTDVTAQVGGGVNNLSSTSFVENGQCAVSNGYAVLFNSSYILSNNSNPVDALNDFRQGLLSAGVEYARGASSLSILTSLSDTSYNNRPDAEILAGLSSTFVEHDISASYTRQIDPNLSFSGQIGLTGVTNDFSLAIPKTLLPHYSASLNWAITPKLSLTGSASRTIAPPTTVIANAETAYQASVNLNYQATAKVGVSAGGSIGTTSTAFTPATVVAIGGFSGLEHFFSAHASVTYSMTPFLAASLSAAYNQQVETGVMTSQDLFTVSLNYKPF